MAQFLVMLQIGYAQLRAEPTLNARLRSAMHDWVDESMTAHGFERAGKNDGTDRNTRKSGVEELLTPRGSRVRVEGATAFTIYRYEAEADIDIDGVMALVVEATAHLPFRVTIAITDGFRKTRIRS